MEEAQRTKLAEAMVQALDERGSTATLADVSALAGISGAALHEVFPDREACLLAAVELAVQRASKDVLAAHDAESRWLDATKAGLVALLTFVEQEPALGRLLLVHSTSGGEQLLRRRMEILSVLAAAIDLGREEIAPGRQPPPTVIAEGVVGAVLAVLQNRLLREPEAGVMDLFGSLVHIIVLPYLGAGVARRELTRPAPRIRPSAGIAPADGPHAQAQGGSVRLTYRTARVLRAIADYPGANNREVAGRAGVVDQGQVSKLLGRLQARGLIAKAEAARMRGAPNSWRLTEQGELLLGEASIEP